MSTIKNKKDLINSINSVIDQQSKSRDNNRLEILKNQLENIAFLNDKEQKLISDTLEVLDKFYKNNQDTNLNPNKLPGNFFKKILNDLSSNDSDIELEIISIDPAEDKNCFNKDNFLGCMVTGFVRHKLYPGGTMSRLQGILLEKVDKDVFRGVGYLNKGTGPPYWLTWDRKYSKGLRDTLSEKSRLRVKKWYNNLVNTPQKRKETIEILIKDGMPKKYAKLLPRMYDLNSENKVTPFGFAKDEDVDTESDEDLIEEQVEIVKEETRENNDNKPEEVSAENETATITDDKEKETMDDKTVETTDNNEEAVDGEKVDEPVDNEGEVVDEKVDEPVDNEGEVVDEKADEPVDNEGEVVDEKADEPVDNEGEVVDEKTVETTDNNEEEVLGEKEEDEEIVDEKEKEDIDNEGNFSEELESIVNENSDKKYISNEDIEKILLEFKEKNNKINTELDEIKDKITLVKNEVETNDGDIKNITTTIDTINSEMEKDDEKIENLTNDIEKVENNLSEISDQSDEEDDQTEKETAEEDDQTEKETIDTQSTDSDIEARVKPNSEEKIDSESESEINDVKDAIHERMKLTIDNLFEDIKKSDVSHLKQVFIDKVAIYMNTLLDSTISDLNDLNQDKETKEQTLKLIIKYNTSILDFLEHKLSLE